jgi:hypothetical protein
MKKVIFFLLGFFILSCSEKPNDYFLLKTNLKTEYSIEYLVPSGEVTGKMVASTGNEININDNKYFIVTLAYSGVPGMENQTYYYRKSNKGIVFLESKEDTIDHIELPSNLKIGEKWRIKTKDRNIKYEIISIEDLITTERTYKECIIIEGNGSVFIDAGKKTETEGDLKAKYYYAKGIGMVKATEKCEVNGQRLYNYEANLVRVYED